MVAPEINMKEDLRKKISEVLNIPAGKIILNNPEQFSHGDYSTNIAMALAKEENKNPSELAEEIARKLREADIKNVEKIAVVAPGFINFHLTRNFFSENIEEILKDKENFGKNKSLEGKKIIVEHTDPNVLKPFHIGHLMSNAIGESISRLFVAQGAEISRLNYFSDSGLNIAMAVWGMKDLINEMPNNDASLEDKINFLGKSYPHGVKSYVEKDDVKEEVKKINLIIHQKVEGDIYKLYQKGKDWSLEYFSILYKKLDSDFAESIAESSVAEQGASLVKEYLEKGIFRESEGAIIFPGEEHGLHTRVFLNKEGLSTYEGKELGVTKYKFEKYSPDISIVVTGNEQNDYFKVILSAISCINESWATKTKHISHGMLRLPTGKMSSRTGEVIAAASLIDEVKENVLEKMKDREIPNRDEVAEQIAIGAIKYSILKQSPGKDIIFDFDKSLSFEGDSGPYLQYTAVRANSVLEKSESTEAKNIPEEITETERILFHFPEVVGRAGEEYSPQYIVTYLLKLAGSFNSFYASTKIIGSEHEAYYLTLTKAVKIVITNGLHLLAIKVPEKM